MNIITEFRKEKSLNGYSLDVLKSAVQKYARRSQLDKLLWSIFEFDTLLSHNFTKDTIRIRTNLHHRMLIIFLEDIGPPGIQYTDYMNDIFQTLDSCRNFTETSETDTQIYSKYKQIEIEQYVKWAWICTHSLKSRESDHYNIYYSRTSPEEPQEIITDAIPSCVNQIKENTKIIRYATQFILNMQNKNIDAMYWAYKIVNSKTTGTYFNKRKPEYLVFWLLSQCTREYISIYTTWFDKLKLNPEAFLTWSNLIIAHCKQSETVSKIELSDIIQKELVAKCTLNYTDTKLKFDEYVYDMHTYIGKTKKRSYKYFAEVSSIVDKEDPSVNQHVKKIYVNYFKDLEFDN
jgi:hypothetical protein